MLQFLRMLFRRAPLLALVCLVWILTAVLAFAGRGRGYRAYSTEHGKLPGISVVMRGIHDHVFPWTDPDAGRRAAGEKAVETAGADASGAGPAGAADGSHGAAEGDGELQGRTETDGTGTDAGNENGQTGGEGAREEIDPAGTASEKEDGTGSEGPSLEVPETSCSKVVKAKDYGVADSRYLSPEDTVYNRDSEGLFAPNGIYYHLQKVDDNYFTDALFIGDSRTVGLQEYGEIREKTSFLARESITVYDLLDSSELMDYTPKGKKASERSMKGLLSKGKFRKIYISVGVNELGIPDTMDYYKEFRKVIKEVNKLQPEAVIYIQGIMHVSRDKSQSDSVFNNTAIVQRNEAIASLANGRNIFYIDMNQVLCDDDGNLKNDLTGDGIHLKASACELWVDFIRNNAVVVPD